MLPLTSRRRKRWPRPWIIIRMIPRPVPNVWPCAGWQSGTAAAPITAYDATVANTNVQTGNLLSLFFCYRKLLIDTKIFDRDPWVVWKFHITKMIAFDQFHITIKPETRRMLTSDRTLVPMELFTISYREKDRDVGFSQRDQLGCLKNFESDCRPGRFLHSRPVGRTGLPGRRVGVCYRLKGRYTPVSTGRVQT